MPIAWFLEANLEFLIAFDRWYASGAMCVPIELRQMYDRLPRMEGEAMTMQRGGDVGGLANRDITSRVYTHLDLPARLRGLACVWREKGFKIDASVYELAADEIDRLELELSQALAPE